MKNLLLILIATSCISALSQTALKETPESMYSAVTTGGVEICGIKQKIMQAKLEIGSIGYGEAYAEINKCILDSKNEAKKAFTNLMAATSKSAAKNAIKNYHVTYVTAINGIPPGNAERKINYEVRQQQLSDKMVEAWARYEVEK